MVKMKTAIVTVGISASGKSSLAQAILQKASENNIDCVEINRDNIRFSEIHLGSDWTTYKHTEENENVVTKIWNDRLNSAIEKNQSVVISDTNLNINRLIPLLDKLASWDYDVQVVFFDIPVEVCIERDKSRGNMSVGENVIRSQQERFEEIKSLRHKIDYPVTYLRG